MSTMHPNLVYAEPDRVRMLLPFWTDAVVQEALGKIRRTFKDYGELLTTEETYRLLRNETIIRNEKLRRPMKFQYGVGNREIHEREEAVIEARVDTPFAVRR